MWAGIGDTYAKYYEAKISSRDERLEHFTAVGVAVSEMCLQPLLEYGVKAYADHQKGLCTYDVEQVVLAIVVTGRSLALVFSLHCLWTDRKRSLRRSIS